MFVKIKPRTHTTQYTLCKINQYISTPLTPTSIHSPPPIKSKRGGGGGLHFLKGKQGERRGRIQPKAAGIIPVRSTLRLQGKKINTRENSLSTQTGFVEFYL